MSQLRYSNLPYEIISNCPITTPDPSQHATVALRDADLNRRKFFHKLFTFAHKLVKNPVDPLQLHILLFAEAEFYNKIEAL